MCRPPLLVSTASRAIATVITVVEPLPHLSDRVCCQCYIRLPPPRCLRSGGPGGGGGGGGGGGRSRGYIQGGWVE